MISSRHGRKEYPHKYIFAGASGHNDSRLNGEFIRNKEFVNGKPSYTHIDHGKKILLWYWPEKRFWMISPVEQVGTKDAYACVKGNSPPHQVERSWLMFSKARQQFVRSRLKATTNEIESDEESSDKDLDDLRKVIEMEKTEQLKEPESLDEIRDETQLPKRRRWSNSSSNSDVLDDFLKKYKHLNQEKKELEQKYVNLKEEKSNIDIQLNALGVQYDELNECLTQTLNQNSRLMEEVSSLKITNEILERKTIKGKHVNLNDLPCSLSTCTNEELFMLENAILEVHRKRVEYRKKEIEKLEQQTICIVCQENKVSQVFDPCGHIFCAICTLRIHEREHVKCPVCRKGIDQTLTMYI